MSIRPDKAMVLAAGLGTRMRPLTDNLPKPLITVAGITLIDYALNWLVASGIHEVAVNSFYKAEMLEAHLAKRKDPVIQISREETLLETGGGIKKALPLLGPSPFFSLNSDTICMDGHTPALRHMAEIWDDRQMDALLLLHPVSQAIGYEGKGDFFMDASGSIRRRLDGVSAPLVFTGVQLIHPRLFADSPPGAFSMNVLYDRGMGKDGTLARVRGLLHDGHWLHIGTPDERAQAEHWFARRK
jgi:N-acetyl-alpha-D-muramate 1-phosphate uridylyltransferase